MSSIYHCTGCQETFDHLMGRCTKCGKWQSMKPGAPGKAIANAGVPLRLDEIPDPEVNRIETGTREFDRVLGGGLVQSGIVLLVGAPGKGKSTLAAQVLMSLADAAEDPCKCLYVTGEETAEQTKPRLVRLYPRAVEMMKVDVANPKEAKFKLLAEQNMHKIARHIDDYDPDVIVIDSIQTMQVPPEGGEGADKSGSVTTLVDVTKYMMQIAKARNLAIIVIGHVNKEGDVGGPMSIQHLVDVVLTFDDERSNEIRILRALKNRFGTTNEVGIFRMGPDGLSSVDDPSEHLKRGRRGAAGSVVGCAMIRAGKGAGSRPMLVEIQALFGPGAKNPKRVITPQGSYESGRLAMLLNVMETHTEMFTIDKDEVDDLLPLSGMDLYVNIAGSFSASESDIDLPVALAIASARLNLPLPPGMVAWGEVDLLGNVRPSGGFEERVKSCEAMNFRKMIASPPEGDMLSIEDALGALYEAKEKNLEKLRKREKRKKEPRSDDD